MVWRRVVEWLVIALSASACASAGGAPTSVADRCVQDGGRWVAALGTCERGTGGGGGY